MFCIPYPMLCILYHLSYILYFCILYPCIPVSLIPVFCILYPCILYPRIPVFCILVFCIPVFCIPVSLYPCIPVSCIPVSNCIRYCLQPEENWKKIKDKVLRKHQQIKNQQNFIFLSWTLQKQRWDTRYILQIVHCTNCTICKLYSKTIFRAFFPCIQCTMYILKQMLKSLRNQQYNLKSWQTFLLVSNLKSAEGNIKGFLVPTINIVSSLKGEKTKLKF